jgi:hypothetical protein
VQNRFNKVIYYLMTRFFYLLLALWALAAGPVSAQSVAPAFYPITAKLGPYRQTFDAMGSTGAPAFTNGSNASLPGIIAGFKYTTGVFGSSPQANPNDGSNASSTAYNFGTTGATDRALGGMAGSLVGGTNTTGYVCVRLRNRSKATIRNFDIRYALEQWYNSSNAQDAYVQASYRVYNDTTSFGANDIVQDNGVNGWTDIPSLKLQAPATGGLVGKADGNSTTYRRTAQYRLTNINLANAREIVVRFSYVFNSATNGNGVSVDDIVIYPETNVFYSNTSGKLTNTAATGGTWSQNADGSGQVGSAIDFSAPNVTYYVQGTNTNSRLTGNWLVTGANSRVVVGTDAAPATLTLAPGDQLTATVDVTKNSTLALQGTPTGLTLGTLAATSTVQYAGNVAGATQAVLPATYAQLDFSGASLKSLAGAATVAEDLSLSSTSATAPQAVQLNDFHLTLLRAATLSRTNGGQLITNGLGEYRATVVGAGSSMPVLFPVALSAAVADYLPVSVTAGANDKDETYRARVISGVYGTYSATGVGSNPTAYTGNVNATWHIGHETSTPVSATLNMDWAVSREGSRFAQAISYLDHYDSGTNKWDAVATGSTPQAEVNGKRGIKRTGVSKFSPFAITSSPAGPLPVVLLSFEARRVGATVACAWATASEARNSHFVVERSHDGASFTALGTVAGQGTSTAAHTYRFVDAQPVAGVAYYRLRQVDTDGTATFSPVVVVQGGEVVAASITAVPNPSAGQFALQLNLPASSQLRGTVVNVLGQSVLTVDEQLPAGPANLPLDLRAQPAGVYLVQLLGPAGPVTLRLLKQ